jgi:hypothetical protein
MLLFVNMNKYCVGLQKRILFLKVCEFLLVKFGVVDLRIVLSIEISMPFDF